MRYLDGTLQKRIDGKLGQLNKLRPLPASALKKLRQHFEIEMTYNSNAIEGNSLTLKETFLVIQEGITVKNKPLKDHLEARGHYEALEFLADLIQHEKKHTLSERLVKTLHQIVIQGVEKEWAGKYRNGNVIIAGAGHRPPDALHVPRRMADLLEWFGSQLKQSHPIELSALLHHQFVHIHPFFDGNGRVGRLLMNVVLMQYGYPLTVILKNDRRRYYRVLAMADSGRYEPLVRFVAQNVERSLNLYLKAASTSTPSGETLLPLSKISPRTPYSTKYLNLLIRQGKLEAHKEGRNWLTSREAVDRYRLSRQRKR